ncbi:MAG: thioredoxin family protein [Salaquimonas sp.]|jgi:thioredoxin-related protein|nr:thioredoxin family protein [Salaquimonas sp.]
MINRRVLLGASAAMLAAGALTRRPLAAQLNDDGLHVQPWFMDTFLDLRDDLNEAGAAGKNFAVFFEQRGCPYCREMHEVNLVRPEIADYIGENFAAVQLNLWGSRAVTDFDGEEMEERQLARKWGVNFTPTISFFAMGEPEQKPGRDLEVARMPGYFKPFHFLSMFEFVREGRYKDTDFQRFLQDKVQKLEAEGVKVDIWN